MNSHLKKDISVTYVCVVKAILSAYHIIDPYEKKVGQESYLFKRKNMNPSNPLNLPLVAILPNSNFSYLSTFNSNSVFVIQLRNSIGKTSSPVPCVIDERGDLSPLDLKVDHHLQSTGFRNLTQCFQKASPSPFSDLIVVTVGSYGFLGVNSHGDLLFNHLRRETSDTSHSSIHHLSEDTFLDYEPLRSYSGGTAHLYRRGQKIWSTYLPADEVNQAFLSSDRIHVILILNQSHDNPPHFAVLKMKDGTREGLASVEDNEDSERYFLQDYRDGMFIFVVTRKGRAQLQSFVTREGHLVKPPVTMRDLVRASNFLERSWRNFLNYIEKSTEGAEMGYVKLNRSRGSSKEEESLFCLFRKQIGDEVESHLLAYNMTAGLITSHLISPGSNTYLFWTNLGQTLFCYYSHPQDETERLATYWRGTKNRSILFDHHPLTWSPSNHKLYPPAQRQRYYYIILLLSYLSRNLPLELIYEILSYIPYEYDLLN